MRRIVVPSDVLAVMSPGEVTLGRRESHYARDVLRLKVGDEVTLIDGVGMTGHGRITAMDKAGVQVFLNEFGKSSALESPLKMTLLVGLPKGTRWELIIQKTTELGVDRIWPIYTHHSDVRIPADRLEQRLDRWTRIAAEAARQCGRALAPDLSLPRPLHEALGLLSQEQEVDLRLVAWEGLTHQADHPDLDEIIGGVTNPKHAVLFVGPEGGLARDEVERCRKHGFEVVGLGPRILRVETAALVFVTLIQHRLGDMH